MRIDWKKLWRGWIRPLIIIVIVTTALRSAVADWNDVPSGSMNPSILEGDRIFVNKLAYDLKLPFTSLRLVRWSRPQRGDIVVFFSPADGKRLVKRVVAVAGDTVEMRNNILLINGRPLEYAAQAAPEQADDSGSDRLIARETLDEHSYPILITPGTRSPRTFGPITVPPGQHFVMGDNRDASYDSRFFGCVDESRIAGVATTVVVSVDPGKSYVPRWDRFFKPLP